MKHKIILFKSWMDPYEARLYKAMRRVYKRSFTGKLGYGLFLGFFLFWVFLYIMAGLSPRCNPPSVDSIIYVVTFIIYIFTDSYVDHHMRTYEDNISNMAGFAPFTKKHIKRLEFYLCFRQMVFFGIIQFTVSLLYSIVHWFSTGNFNIDDAVWLFLIGILSPMIVLLVNRFLEKVKGIKKNG